MMLPEWRAAFGLSDLEVVAELDEIVAVERALAVRRLELAGEVSGRRIARCDGCSPVPAWLRNRYRVGNATAARMMNLAGHLPSMPHLAKALGEGDLSEEQTAIAVKAVANLPEGLRTDGQHCLISQGGHLEPELFAPFASGLLDYIAPDVGEERARKALERQEARAANDRSFTVSRDGTGRYRVHGYTNAEGAATINAALDPLCNPARYRRPGGAESAGHGDQNLPAAFRDPRTAPQRRHDALLEVFGLALATGELPENGGDKAQVVVTMPLDAVSGEVRAGLLDNGAKLSPEAVRRLACDAGIIPAVLDGHGVPLDLGRTSTRELLPSSAR